MEIYFHEAEQGAGRERWTGSVVGVGTGSLSANIASQAASRGRVPSAAGLRVRALTIARARRRSRPVP